MAARCARQYGVGHSGRCGGSCSRRAPQLDRRPDEPLGRRRSPLAPGATCSGRSIENGRRPRSAPRPARVSHLTTTPTPRVPIRRRRRHRAARRPRRLCFRRRHRRRRRSAPTCDEDERAANKQKMPALFPPEEVAAALSSGAPLSCAPARRWRRRGKWRITTRFKVQRGGSGGREFVFLPTLSYVA